MSCTTFTAKKWRRDRVMGRLFNLVAKNHVIPESTKKHLSQLKFDDFCQENMHFCEIKGLEKDSMYLHYITSTWYIHSEGAFKVKIDSVSIYDSYIAYESARQAKLQMN